MADFASECETVHPVTPSDFQTHVTSLDGHPLQTGKGVTQKDTDCRAIWFQPLDFATGETAPEFLTQCGFPATFPPVAF